VRALVVDRLQLLERGDCFLVRLADRLAIRRKRRSPMGNRPMKPCSDENMWKSVSANSPSMCRSPSAYCSSRVLPSNGRSSVARTMLCAPSALIRYAVCACSRLPSAWRSTTFTGLASCDKTSCEKPISSTLHSTTTPRFSMASRRTCSVSACDKQQIMVAAINLCEVEA
jgi:hypothetical protein